MLRYEATTLRQVAAQLRADDESTAVGSGKLCYRCMAAVDEPLAVQRSLDYQQTCSSEEDSSHGVKNG